MTKRSKQSGRAAGGKTADGGPKHAEKLKGLAADIRDGHSRCLAALKGVVEQARDTGKALIKAKNLLGHGGWSGWVEDNCGFAMRMAQNYMQVARNYDAVLARCAGADAWRLTEFLKVAQRLEWERRGKAAAASRADAKPDPFALPPGDVARRQEMLRAGAGADKVLTETAVAGFLRRKLDALYAEVRRFAASKGVVGLAGEGLDPADVGILLVESLKAGLDPAGLVVLAATVSPPPEAATPVASDRHDAPVTSDRPEASVASDRPETPVASDRPEAPVASDQPAAPVASDQPAAPVASDRPDPLVTSDRPYAPVTTRRHLANGRHRKPQLA